MLDHHFSFPLRMVILRHQTSYPVFLVKANYPQLKKLGPSRTTFKAFYGGFLVDQMMQPCHWQVHNTFIHIYLKGLPWSVNDINMYLVPLITARQVQDTSPQNYHPGEKEGGAQPMLLSLPEPKNPGTSGIMDTIIGYLVRVSFSLILY